MTHMLVARLAHSVPLRVVLCMCAAATLQGRALKGQAPTPPPSELSARDLNVWGRFGAGTWKQARIVTETLNDQGRVIDTTITETKTTLVKADSRRLTLRIETTVEVAGKRFESQPQQIEYGYYGEAPSERSESKTVGTERLVIDGQQVPCQIRQVSTSGRERQVTLLYLSDDVEPFVMKRETTTLKDDVKPASNPRTTSEVIALDMPYKVL